MAIKVMYRVMNIETGHISLWDYNNMSGYVTLNEIKVEYDDQFRDEHRSLIIEAIDERRQKLQKEMIVLEQRKQELLCISYKPVEDEIIDHPF
jgi:hypothetical protein